MIASGKTQLIMSRRQFLISWGFKMELHEVLQWAYDDLNLWLDGQVSDDLAHSTQKVMSEIKAILED